MEIEEKELLTRHQLKTLQLQEAICKDFLELRKNYPAYSSSRQMKVIASRHDITYMGVRRILIRAGVFEANGRNPIIHEIC